MNTNNNKPHYHKVGEIIEDSKIFGNTYPQNHAILSLIIMTVNADGKLANEEKDEIFKIRKTILSNVDEETLDEMFNDIVDKGNLDSIEHISELFPRLVDRIRLYEIAYGICLSDNNLHKLEKKLLKKYAYSFNLSKDIIEEIHTETKSEYWGEK